MTDYKQRVKDEKKELDERIERLTSYIHKPEFKEIDLLEQDLMLRQLGYMNAYSSTLLQRIEIHEGEKK